MNSRKLSLRTVSAEASNSTLMGSIICTVRTGWPRSTYAPGIAWTSATWPKNGETSTQSSTSLSASLKDSCSPSILASRDANSACFACFVASSCAKFAVAVSRSALALSSTRCAAAFSLTRRSLRSNSVLARSSTATAASLLAGMTLSISISAASFCRSAALMSAFELSTFSL